jgi:hypothetical protein
MKIALTITHCKRLELLKIVLSDFINYINGLDLISDVILYDDSGTESDRVEILKLIMTLFKGKKIQFRFYNPEDILSKRRHRFIMSQWIVDISEYDYIFHLEDDWEMTSNINLNEIIDVFENNPIVGYIGLTHDKPRWVPDVYGSQVLYKDFWKWNFKKSLGDYWFSPKNSNKKYYNWPGFSLRPGMFNVKNILTLGDIPDVDAFEYYFGLLYSENYDYFFYKNSIFDHIGDTSAYKLNNSKR